MSWKLAARRRIEDKEKASGLYRLPAAKQPKIEGLKLWDIGDPPRVVDSWRWQELSALLRFVYWWVVWLGHDEAILYAAARLRDLARRIETEVKKTPQPW